MSVDKVKFKLVLQRKKKKLSVQIFEAFHLPCSFCTAPSLAVFLYLLSNSFLFFLLQELHLVISLHQACSISQDHALKGLVCNAFWMWSCLLSFIASYEPSGTGSDGFAGCVLLHFSNRTFLYLLPNSSALVIKCRRDSVRLFTSVT